MFGSLVPVSSTLFLITSIDCSTVLLFSSKIFCSENVKLSFKSSAFSILISLSNFFLKILIASFNSSFSRIVTVAPIPLLPRFLYLIFSCLKDTLTSSTISLDFSLITELTSTSKSR